MHTQQLEKWFDELMHALRQRTVFVNQGDDPVYFLVYPPGVSVEVYQLLPDWQKKLKHAGWTPHTYNVGMALVEFIDHHPDTEWIIDHEREHPDDQRTVIESVRQLIGDGTDATVVESWVLEQIDAVSKLDNGVLLLTGIELLHPYLQIGRIEQRLQGRFTVPTVVFYPGSKTSTFGLRYLGFYEPDGNYRSRHIGGTRA
ncbi:MAG: BREX protein BrxB domain-containing protein [Spirochaetota bacterium]